MDWDRKDRVRFLTLALGGVVGSFLRYGLVMLSIRWAGVGFPYGILAANWIGSFVIALVATWLGPLMHSSAELRLFLTVGLLGSFTTFSTFSLDSLRMIKEGQPGLALSYVLLSVVGGLVLAWLGYGLGEQLRAGATV